jgi:hypothetical protein
LPLSPGGDFGTIADTPTAAFSRAVRVKKTRQNKRVEPDDFLRGDKNVLIALAWISSCCAFNVQADNVQKRARLVRYFQTPFLPRLKSAEVISYHLCGD